MHGLHGRAGLAVATAISEANSPSTPLLIQAETLLDVSQLSTVVHLTCCPLAILNQDSLLDALVDDKLAPDEVVINL